MTKRLLCVSLSLVCHGFVVSARLHAQTGNGGAAIVPIDPEAVPRPELRITEIDQTIAIDGLLNESVWAGADSASDFITALPRDGYPASERTVVRVLYWRQHWHLDGTVL